MTNVEVEYVLYTDVTYEVVGTTIGWVEVVPVGEKLVLLHAGKPDSPQVGFGDS